MAGTYSILAALHSLSHQGEQVMGREWASFFYTLRSYLKQAGLEDQQSGEELLLFGFSQPLSALNAVFEGLDRVKKEFSWPPDRGAVPIQIIFHLEKEGDFPPPFRDSSSNLWDLLEPETPYVSRPLKTQWEQLMAGRKLPSCHFGDEEMGLFPVRFADRVGMRTESLFPHRDLPRRGPMKECFYCGMTHHAPADCPSKLLTLEMKGLAEVGYLPLPRLNVLYEEVFSDLERMVNILGAGVRMGQLRKDLALQVFVAYFDFYRLYQPRFLRNIAFSVYSRWEDMVRDDKVAVDSHGLHFGLDCLRVGQYTQAEELFVNESRRPKGKQFYATIGRAFLALEMDRENDMGYFLESAASMAVNDREKLYIAFLLSRYYALRDNPWKAEQALDNIFALDRHCAEGIYRHVQLLAAGGFGDKALRQLRSLVAEDRQFFMLALMDPALQPVRGAVEDLLFSLQQTQEAEAEENLVRARQQVEELRSWLEEDDQELVEIVRDLENLEKQRERGSYYDTIDAAAKGKGMAQACFRIQEARLDELAERLERTVGRWKGYRNYWKNYTYQPLFKKFYATLDRVRDRLSEARPLAEKNRGGKVYRQAVEMLDGAEEALDGLGPMITRMHWIKILLDGIRVFATRLVVTEIALIALLVGLFSVLTAYLAGTVAAGLVDLLRDPMFQKQTLFVVTLFVAPVAALAQTLWKIMGT